MSVIEVYVYGKGSGVRIAEVLDFFRRPVNYVAVRARGRAPCAFEIAPSSGNRFLIPWRQLPYLRAYSRLKIYKSVFFDACCLEES